MLYTVREQQNKSLFTGKVRSVTYTVENKSGIYASLQSKENAEIVCFGLNNGFETSYLGGFSDFVVDQIKAAMTK